MTEILNKEFSRRSFLKGGGAMVVGFSLVGASSAGRAHAATSPYANSGSPDLAAIDSWLAIHSDNTATVKSGIMELGQGSSTGLLMIAGEELDMEMSQLRWIDFDSAGPNVTPDNGNTGNSSAIRVGGVNVRRAAAEARQVLLNLASAKLGVPVAGLTVTGGVVSGGGKTVRYGDLLGDKPFNVKFTGKAPLKPVSSYKLVATRVPRIDIPDKISGKYTYIQNVRVPGMLHGRIVRPRGQTAYGNSVKPLSIDASSIKHIPNVQILRRGDFLGVVAPLEYDAVRAATQLKVKWEEPKIALPGSGNVFSAMRAAPSLDRMVANTGDVGKGLASATIVRSATFSGHYASHAPIGPHAAIADVTPNGAVVIGHLKNGYPLRETLAMLLGLPESLVRVRHAEGSSSFGSGAIWKDAAEAAAVMSQLAGKPVRVQYMRWDEAGWDNYGGAQLMDVRAGIDAKGNIVAFDVTGWITPEGGTNRYKTEELVGYGPLDPGIGGRLFDPKNGAGFYAIPNYRVIGKAKVWTEGILPIASMRQQGQSLNTFASEQIIDELAYAAKMDPLAFRLQNLTDPRWRGPMIAAAQLANWQPRVANSITQTGKIRTGRGIGVGNHSGGNAAGVAEIEVNMQTGKIVVSHMYGAQDSGLVVAPAQLENQMSGALVQATGRALNEAVKFDTHRVTSVDWVTYPIGRFKDHPKVSVAVVQNKDVPSQGAGESIAAVPHPAIANAFFDATGVRIRQVPMTPAVVRATLMAAGVK
jgi:CO/xanthine dehydrogenase Mo-binding subunit